MLKQKEVHTNILFENIQTISLKIRALIEITIIYQKNRHNEPQYGINVDFSLTKSDKRETLKIKYKLETQIS